MLLLAGATYDARHHTICSHNRHRQGSSCLFPTFGSRGRRRDIAIPHWDGEGSLTEHLRGELRDALVGVKKRFFWQRKQQWIDSFDRPLDVQDHGAVISDGNTLGDLEESPDLSPADMAVLLPIIDFKFRDPAEGTPILGDNVISMEDHKGEK